MTGGNRLPALAAEIRRAHADVQEAAKTAAERAIAAGDALIEAKELVQHGEWLPWLREHCALAERTAQLYMKIAKSGLNSATVADLGLKAAAAAFLMPYPFYQPFSEGTEDEQREWWLYCLFLCREGWSAEAAWDHIFWVTRHDYRSPDDWLGPSGQKWVCLWGGWIGAKFIERWRSFRAEQSDRSTKEIEAELAAA